MARPIDADDFLKHLTLCTDKGHYGEFMDGSEVAYTIREIASALESQPTFSPWVSVEERMPEDDAPEWRRQITVMATTDRGRVKIASRFYEPERKAYGRVYPAKWTWGRMTDDVFTHWMPLPEPPGKEG